MLSQVSFSQIAIYHHNCRDDQRRRCHQQCPSEMMTMVTDEEEIKLSTKLTNSSCNTMCSSPGRGATLITLVFPLISLGFPLISKRILLMTRRALAHSLGSFSVIRISAHFSWISTHESLGHFARVLKSSRY